MPKVGDQYQGNFGMYPAGGGGDFPDDEVAVSDAIDLAFGCCGNAGQETLIGDIADSFEDWANDVLEGKDDAGTEWMDFVSLLFEWYGGRQDKVQGTIDIWRQSWNAIAEQSGYHDKQDETMHEEVGQVFG